MTQLVLTPPGNRHATTFPGQRLRDAPSNTGRSPGDHGRFALQSHRLEVLLSVAEMTQTVTGPSMRDFRSCRSTTTGNGCGPPTEPR